LILADVRELPDAVHIADRPQALACAQPRVDRNSATVGFDSDSLQADVCDAWAASGGDEQPITTQLATVIEFQDGLIPFASRGRRAYAQRDFDAVTTECVGECFPQRPGLAREYVRGAFDEHRFAAQSLNRLRHLHADRATAEHDQSTRDSLHARRVTTRPQ